LVRCNEAGKTQGKDNSILKMKITMVLTAGDPLFKMPGVANEGREAVEQSSVDEAGTVSEGNARITADLDASLVRPVLTTALPEVFGRLLHSVVVHVVAWRRFVRNPHRPSMTH
jgi:hypothetical protein